jgi:hypothetical protein
MADAPERLPEVPQQTGAPESGAVDGGVQETAPPVETYIEKLEKNNVQVRADDFQAPVLGDQGQQLTTPIPSNVPTITVPANQVQLIEWAKGPEDKAITWLSRYWIRLIKKSVHFGWRLIMPPPPQPVQQIQQTQPAQLQPMQQNQVTQPVQVQPQIAQQQPVQQTSTT